MQNYVEHDGEVLPSYTGPNAPRYASGTARDTEVPHDRYSQFDVIEGQEEASLRQIGLAAIKDAQQDLLDKGANPNVATSSDDGVTVRHLSNRGYFQ